MDAAEIVQRMNARIDEVLEILLPGGRRVGHEYEVGSLEGEPGRSLRVHLTGSKLGVWKDFSSPDKGGDLISLWANVRGITMGQAMKDICEHFNWKDDRPRPAVGGKRKESYRKLREDQVRKERHLYGVLQVKEHLEKKGRQDPYGPALGYLVRKRRITEEIATMFRIFEKAAGEWTNKDREKHGQLICFPYYRPGGELANVKYVALERDERGRKWERQEHGVEPCLFGWQAIGPMDSIVVLTEGEIDAMTWRQWGFPAMSVPNGAGAGAKLDWIESEYENMDRFVRIYLSFDHDQEPPPGTPYEERVKWEKKRKSVADGVEGICKRLGFHRCLVVTLPEGVKDANDGLQRGMTSEHAQQCLDAARFQDPEELKQAGAFYERVVERFYPTERAEGESVRGFYPPWAKQLGHQVVIEMGKVLIIHGLSGHGKSEFCRYTELQAAEQGFVICKASLEEPGEEQFEKQAQQAAGVRIPSRDHLWHVFDWLNNRFLVYNIVGVSKIERMLEVFAYAAKRYGANFFVVDSLTRLELEQDTKWRGDKNEAQATLINRLNDFTQEHGVILTLVCHDVKGDRKERHNGFAAMPTMQDIRGAGQIGDLVNDIWMMYKDDRNTLDKKPNPTYGKSLLEVQKNRRYGEKPRVVFTFSKDTRQFLLGEEQPRAFVPDPAGQNVWEEVDVF